MSLEENRPKVHSNYWRAVMQGQRPFRFALIVVKKLQTHVKVRITVAPVP